MAAMSKIIGIDLGTTNSVVAVMQGGEPLVIRYQEVARSTPSAVAISKGATAAALAYGLDKKSDETSAVADLGGGTFDISVLEVGAGVVEVKSTNGDTHLGGADVDQRIVDWLIDEFKKKNNIDLSKDKMALQRLKDAAEKAKVELSQMLETEINLPVSTAGANGPIHMGEKLTRTRLEQMMNKPLDRSMKPVKQALEHAKISQNDIQEVDMER